MFHRRSMRIASRASNAFLANNGADLIRTISALPRLHADIKVFNHVRPLMVVPLPTSDIDSRKLPVRICLDSFLVVLLLCGQIVQLVLHFRANPVVGGHLFKDASFLQGGISLTADTVSAS